MRDNAPDMQIQNAFKAAYATYVIASNVQMKRTSEATSAESMDAPRDSPNAQNGMSNYFPNTFLSC